MSDRRKPQKKFDAVKMMREIRDDLSRTLASMSHQEQAELIRQRLAAQAARSKH